MTDEDVKELHKWRTGHMLASFQEDLNAMQARAVDAEAAIARVREAVARLNALSIRATVDQAANAYMDSAEEIEAALKGKPCE